MRSLIVSPWTDITELISVYNCIYDQNNNEKSFDCEMLLFAKNKLTIWLTRVENNHEINVNLMATKAIISAFIQDSSRDEFRDETAIYSLYALSVIRFCTAISQYSHESNMKSVKRLAHKYSCPQWIIDCRHSLCHSAHNQPSIEQLRSAAMIGLNWLKQFYWEKIISVNNYNDNDFFELIHRYIDKNNIKIRKKIKKEVIFAIKHSRNEFILALIKHLVNPNSDSNDNEVNYEYLKIGKIVLRKFAPIFTIINSFNSLSILLYLIINEFDSDNRSICHLALSWFSSIIKAIKSDNKVSKFQRSFASVTYSSVMPRIEWVRLLYRIAKHPNEHTSSLIVLIAPFVSDFISDEKIQIIINLSNLFCTRNGCENDDQIEDVVDNSDKEDNIKSVEDLIESVKGNNGISDSIDWTLINLGATYSLPSNED